MDSSLQEKAAALRERLGYPPWFQTVGVGELGGEPAIFVYVTRKPPELTVPDVWRGVKVWVRRSGKIVPAGECGAR